MKNKKIILVIVSLVLVAAIGAGIFFMSSGNQETVGVYPFNMVGMDGYWGDSQESYGPVTTDKIQTVYLSDTQTITEVMVAQGDEVKKGDILMTFDTSLSDLQLERKRLEVEKLKLQLLEAQEELKKIVTMEPMQEMDDSFFPTPSLPETSPGKPIPAAYVYQPNVVKEHNGLTPETAFICWLRSDTPISNAMLEDMRQYLWSFYGLPSLCEHGNLSHSCAICNPEKCEHGEIKADCPICNCTHGENCPICSKCVHGVIKANCPVCSPALCEHLNNADFCPECHRCVHGILPGECEICDCPHGSKCILCNKCQHGVLIKDCPLCNCPHDDGCTICHPVQPDPTPAPDPLPAPQPEPKPEPEAPAVEADTIAFNSAPYRIQFLANTSEGEGSEPPLILSTDMEFYVVFKTTTGDTDLGDTNMWQGLRVIYKDNQFSQQFFAPMIEDYTQPEMDEEDSPGFPEFDFGSGFTATQIANMRIEQEKKIKEIEFDIKLATAEYKIMQKEVSDGHVYAEIDGKVVSLLTEEEAKSQMQPIVKVSGGGGFFITGSVSELEKDSLKPGQEVTVNDWSNGGMYTGTVRDIGDFPSLDGYWNGAGNPNTSYYPFTVFVGEEASLQAGSYANIQYSTSDSSGGIYMDRAFVRTEDGSSYVFVLGTDGRLEKRFVTVGKSLWGSYLEITSGLTVEDYIAFPYGKDVKEGAPAEEKDISELYSY